MERSRSGRRGWARASVRYYRSEYVEVAVECRLKFDACDGSRRSWRAQISRAQDVNVEFLFVWGGYGDVRYSKGRLFQYGHCG